MTTSQNTQTITTTYKTHAVSGAGRITAKGMGRQRTMPYDPRYSANVNHGMVAGVLANILGWERDDNLTHMGFNDGTHKFVRTL
jgi:hypothetical protein